MKERSSVNVNTGERVVIAAHDKITFTPDAVMRDMVNKPFAHFETVIVDGNDTPAPKKEEVKKEEPKPVEEPKKEEPKPVEEPKVEEPEKPEPKVEEPKKVEEPQKVEPKKEEPKVEVEVKEEPVAEESSSKLKYVVAGIICAVVLCVAGYFASNKGGEAQQPQKVEVAKTQAQQAQTQQEEAAKKAQAEAQAQQAQAQAQQAQAQQAQQAQAEDFDKYNKDARVKYGAYSIVGVDTIVTVYKGQTLKGISKAYFGPGMECYVEAFNETKEVKAGDKVRIPKLKVKKRSKK